MWPYCSGGDDIREVKVPPQAALLIESMRDIGYSLETALADIVDNSITAGATSIDIFTMISDSDVKIGIVDNGKGMDEEELLNAMRPGSRNPREGRSEADLGRFGLGLKTASFSQCRKTTVVSRKDHVTVAAVWDLKLVADTDDWIVQIPDEPELLPWVDKLGSSGTVVIWERLDRVVEHTDSGPDITNFVSRIDEAREHLELVFHRYLIRENGHRKITIRLNGKGLAPFDPFHSSHPATIAGPVEKIKVGPNEVVIQTFTLPHHKKVPSREWVLHAGSAGYVKNQGFYVYRERRLIIHGTWFNLARQTELTKLARVRIDMPNGMDAEWKIDVMKASAQPPRQIRDRLRRIIDTIGANSKRVYAGAGTRLISDNRLPVWNRVQNKNEISYQLNREHPMLMNFSHKLPEYLVDDYRRIMDLAGAGLPMDSLFADFGTDPNAVSTGLTSDDTLSHAVVTTYEHLVHGGDVTHEDALVVMRVAEPFRSAWERTEEIIEQFSNRGDSHGV